MNPEIKELLAVLDMTKEEQCNWVDKHCEQEGWTAPISGDFVPTESLADLAFRKRNEVCKDTLACVNYHKALYIVYRSFCKAQEGTINQNMVYYELWLESFITAIERVVAALIAEILAKGKTQ